jgi:bifunctional polynucleotide phosphatase/kinase
MFRTPTNIQIDKAASYFVGDAAGRPGDHASTDRKWAMNIGIPFFTPEVTITVLAIRVHFEKLSTGILPQSSRTRLLSANRFPSVLSSQMFVAKLRYQAKHWYILMSAIVPLITPTSSPILPPRTEQSNPDIVLFYGYPCVGKSSFFRKHFQVADYTHINQDTLRSREKCIKALQQAIDAGQNCVVGNVAAFFKFPVQHVTSIRPSHR